MLLSCSLADDLSLSVALLNHGFLHMEAVQMHFDKYFNISIIYNY